MQALLIGYTNDIDDDTYNSFAHTGTLHILSVSGMHVALVYAILLAMITFACKYVPRLEKFKNPILILLIWFYATASGFSASTVRSAFMISVLLVGQIINRKSNGINTLLVSAFLLLVYNPYYLLDVGFQLSFLAVLGLLVFNTRIVNWYVTENSFVNALWQLTAVSISAQIFTLPLCLYYFHQFPFVFIIANLLIIPLSDWSIKIGFSYLALSFIPIVNQGLEKVLDFILWLLLRLSSELEHLPFAYAEGIVISVGGMILLYLCMFAFVYGISNKRLRYLNLCLVLMLLFIGLKFNEQLKSNQQIELVVYNNPKNATLDVFAGNERFSFYANDSLKLTTFSSSGHRTLNPKIYNHDSVLVNNSIVSIANKKIGWITHKMDLDSLPVNLDYIIYTDYKKAKGTSNQTKLICTQRTKTECYYNTSRQGAWVLELTP